MNRRSSSGAFTVTAVVDGKTYEVRLNVETLRIASGASSATLAFTASCYMKDGANAPSLYSCYFSVFLRTGTSQAFATRYTGKVSSRPFSGISVASTVDAIVVYATDTVVANNGSAPTTFLAKKEIAVVKAGDNAVVYSLEPSQSTVNFRSNAVGEFLGSKTLTCAIKKTVGNAAATTINSGVDGKYLYCRLNSDNYNFTWTSYSQKTFSAEDVLNDGVTGVEYALSTSSTAAGVSSDNIVTGITVPIIFDGRRGVTGEQGATGKMFYSMGEWDPNVTYTKTGDLVPLVFLKGDYNSDLGVNGSYWYLANADSDTGTRPRSTTGNPWKEAEDFGIVITQGIFAEFAKLGKAIMSGDYMFSMNGRVDGSEIVNGNQWKSMVAYTLFDGDPVDKAFSASGSKTIGTSNVSLHDGAIQLNAGETLVLKLVVSARVATTRLRLYAGSTAVKFDYISSSGGTTWSTISDASTGLGLALTTYFVRYAATADCSCYLRAYKTSGSGIMTYTLDRLVFEPNWWVELLTGKMSAASGNFVVFPDGRLSIAKDKFTVDSDGDVVANDITIKGSLLFHKVDLDYSGAAERQLFTMYDANGSVVQMTGTTASNEVVKVTLDYDVFVVSGAYKSLYDVFLPPAKYFPGARIKIVNGTYDGGNGTAVTSHQSILNINVFYPNVGVSSPGEYDETFHEQDGGYMSNCVTAAIPVDYTTRGGVASTLVGPIQTANAIKVWSSNHKAYGIQISGYRTIELVSTQNPYLSTKTYYAWMIVDAKE